MPILTKKPLMNFLKIIFISYSKIIKYKDKICNFELEYETILTNIKYLDKHMKFQG